MTDKRHSVELAPILNLIAETLLEMTQPADSRLICFFPPERQPYRVVIL